MDIGIAFDLKTDFVAHVRSGAPDDCLEEYDSMATVDAIAGALRELGHDVRKLGGGRAFVRAVLADPPALVFNIAEGRGSRSREAHVPAICEMLEIPCTHSDPLTMALTLDKAMAKRVVASHGLATAGFAVVERAEQLAQLELTFPLFVKPLAEGSSMGIRLHSRVSNSDQLHERVVALLDAYREPVLVEEYLPGAEFTAAVLGNGSHARVLGPAEIVPRRVSREDFVYSLEVKRAADWADIFEYQLPPRRPPEQVAAVEALALEAYRALGCRDIARIDLRVGRDGKPQFIECNPLPGIAPGWSDLAQLWQRLGHTYEELIQAILRVACERMQLPFSSPL